MAFLNVVQDHGNEPDAETSEAFQKMFIAALLLTGSAAGAECSILEGIKTLDQGEVSGAAALQGTLKAAVVPQIRRERLAIQDLSASGLPIELRRVLLLREDLRRSFVLRLLVGLPLCECSRLLSLETCQVEQNIVSAALALAVIRRQEAESALAALAPTVRVAGRS
jgi:hypothetical protein